jgi:hypothetical protein
MQSSIHRKNLEHFRDLLAQSVDEAERRMLLSLIKKEEAKDKPPAVAKRGEAES